MKASLDTIHSAIAEIAARDKESITKLSLSDIAEIPEKDWSLLRAKLFAGEVQVRELAISSLSFNVFAADSDKAGFKLFTVLSIALPIVALVLAFTYSWWFVLVAIASIFFHKTAKSFYRTVIFQGVTASEMAFCFLFSRNTICLLRDGKVVFRKNR